MKAKKQAKPTTIAAYIKAAPSAGQPHLRRLNAILKGVAPKAEGAIKWGAPFYVEPRFLFAFSAHRNHLDLAPGIAVMDHFRDDFGPYKSTKYMLQVRYDQKLPETLIRRMAKECLKRLRARETDSFW